MCRDTPPERKIIHTEYPRCGLGGQRGGAENPEDRIATEGHPQAGDHPRPGFAARLTPENANCLGQPHGPLGTERSERGKAFGKGLAPACGGGTTEAPDV